MIDEGFTRRAAASVLLAGVLGMTGAAVPAAAAPALRGQLLPVPAGGPGRQVSVTAVDVSPLGAVAGNAQIVTTGPDGSATFLDQPQRWAGLPRAGWVRQRLPLLAGATSGRVSGLTDLGEAAGSVTGASTRAVRWSIDGRSAIPLGDDRSAVDAVGPSGPWGVSASSAESPIAGESELVDRAGTRTPLRGTPELESGHRRTAGSIGGPRTAVVRVTEGIGRGTTARPVLWRDGVRTPLTTPAGWDVASVVELTDAGLLIANLRTADSLLRPAAWRLGR